MKRTLLSLIIGMGLAGSALADDLKQVYQQALANDPLVNQAKAQRDAAYEGISVSRANLLPQISGTVGYTMSSSERTDFAQGPDQELQINIIDSDSDTLSYGLDLDMSLYNYANWVGLDRAEKVAEQSDAQYAASMQQLIVRVVNAYFDVLRARDNVEFVRAEKRAIERQLDQTRQRFEVGLTAITDVHEAQANFDNTVAQEIQAENQLEFALETLRVITGKYHDRLYALDTDSFSATIPTPNTVDAWLETAEEKNLALLVDRLAMDIAKEDISSARAGHFPTLGLSATAGRTQSDVSSQGRDIDLPSLDSYSVGVQLNVPIFQGLRVSSQTDQARYLYVAASQQVEQTYRQTVQSVRSSYNNVKAAISTIRALEQAVVSADSALKATEAGFDVGTRTIVDVLNSTRNLFDARRNLASARYDFIQAIVSLKEAAGTLTKSDIEQINRGLQPPSTE
ncbi:outer membrane channel protein TolC [Alteromonas sp. ASW11-19]|uniref:Outer membrane channel protein TolC n=1 Tax=Alteromonas salexigens TaxID=2982530 RepID=A0ABT2VJ16_9ALTE|nr:outer membrane channel protein TolC [Alteromonas salexigens]MCU7553024.1 outer membrane channel protein TolC [Alteromonas salexigens]